MILFVVVSGARYLKHKYYFHHSFFILIFDYEENNFSKNWLKLSANEEDDVPDHKNNLESFVHG